MNKTIFLLILSEILVDVVNEPRRMRSIFSTKRLSAAIFVSPAKQKRDICIAFPASSLSSSAAA